MKLHVETFLNSNSSCGRVASLGKAIRHSKADAIVGNPYCMSSEISPDKKVVEGFHNNFMPSRQLARQFDLTYIVVGRINRKVGCDLRNGEKKRRMIGMNRQICYSL